MQSEIYVYSLEDIETLHIYLKALYNIKYKLQWLKIERSYYKFFQNRIFIVVQFLW